jgi:spermidine synthase
VRPRRSRVAIALGIGLASVLGSWTAVRASEKSGVVHREQSLYGEIVVADDEDRNLRFLVLDGLANTAVRRGTWDSQADSMFGLELAAFARPASRRALLIGLGGGALVHALDRYHALPTDVVEIDPAVVRVAGEMFGFRPSGRVVVGDGRTFLRTSAERWDLILLDVFVGDRQPTHLFSLQSMREASGRLTENGVLAIHAVGWAYGPQSKLRRSIEATLREAFPHVRTLACNPRIPLRDGCGSIVFYASSAPIEFLAALEEARVDLATWWSAVERRFLDEGRNASLDQGPFPTAEILTDETNRFERLSAPAFLHMRAGMLQLPR